MSKIEVVMLEPGKEAYTAVIENSLKGMQSVVGGLIEPVYPFDEQVCMICNEEGKINGLPLNRAILDEDGKVVDIIAGVAFICDCSGESFKSLSKSQLIRYMELFRYPQCFCRIGNVIVAIPLLPNDM